VALKLLKPIVVPNWLTEFRQRMAASKR